MTKREWKYLGRKWRQRHGWDGYSFRSFTYKIEDFKPLDLRNKTLEEYTNPFLNFAILVPKESFKPIVHREKKPNRSQVRFNINWQHVSFIRGKHAGQVKHERDGLTIYSSRTNI